MRHRSHLVIDGMYYSYLLIPSHKYRTRVPAGWLSLLINAGEGIDVDVFFFRQDKSKSMERIGRRIRLNRSKITNSNNLIVDFKASQLEKDLITTDRKDLQELKERLQKYGQQAYGKQTT